MEYPIIRQRRKTISIAISALGEVVIKAPLFLSFKSINEYVSQKQNWINKTRARIEKQLMPITKVVSYESILVLGEEYPIEYTNNTKIAMIKNKTVILPSIASLNPKRKISFLKSLLTEEASRHVIEKVRIVASVFRFSIKNISLNNNKSRWGFCDAQSNISLNFRAIMLPENLLNYLIIHELAHTIVFNHSKSFWEKVEECHPSFRSDRVQLKNLGALLTLYR